MKTFVMLHGINHNMFGKRDPAQYGTITLDEIDSRLQALGKELGVAVQSFQTNSEGDMCERIHKAFTDKADGVLINAGAAVVNINILAQGVTTFTRDVTIGGNQFTEEIQKQLSVSYEEAEALKVGGGRSDADAVVPQEVEKVMSQVAEQVAGEIQRSLDFYAGTAADANFTKVYLSGGTAKVPALFKTIESRVGVPVEILNPFKKIEIDNRKFDPAFIMDVAPQAAVAVGLALRKPGDKLD